MHTGIEKTDEVHKSARTFQLNTWNFAQAGELKM